MNIDSKEILNNDKDDGHHVMWIHMYHILEDKLQDTYHSQIRNQADRYDYFDLRLRFSV